VCRRNDVPVKKLKLTASKRLDQALGDWLPEVLGRPVSKSKVRKLIMAGAVRLHGRPERIASKVVSAGTMIEAHIDVSRLFEDSTSRDTKFELTPERVLFEDEDLIVIDKPSGLPSHPTADEARDNLFAAVGRFLSSRDGIAEPYLGIHQRLDRDTSGVVLFTKSKRVNAAVGEIFSSHKVVKIYQALTVATRQKLPKEWTIKNCLGKVASKSKRAKYGAVKMDGDLAETFFRVIGESPRGVWIEAIPKTGRTHQIRVHLAEYGLPILGDDLYGAADDRAPRLMLHAAELRFPHPMTKCEVSVKSLLPEDFQECLRQIRTR
jgi:23S rRNA pseudouridine1911/1915/1917 synthase